MLVVVFVKGLSRQAAILKCSEIKPLAQQSNSFFTFDMAWDLIMEIKAIDLSKSLFRVLIK